MLNWFLNLVQSATQSDKILSHMSNISADVKRLNKRIREMALDLEALKAEVTRAQTVQASAVVLLKGLASELEAKTAELAAAVAHVVPPVDTSGLDQLTADLKAGTDAFAAAIADSWDKKDTTEVILNADNPEVPTVSVIMPEVLPEAVEVKTEVLVDTIDPASPEPQVAIVVEPVVEAPAPVELPAEAPVEAPAEVVAPVEAPVVEDVIKTEEGLVDVTVTAPAAEVEALAAEGVEVMEAVKEAYEAAPEVTAEPVAPAVEAPVEAPAEEAPKAE